MLQINLIPECLNFYTKFSKSPSTLKWRDDFSCLAVAWFATLNDAIVSADKQLSSMVAYQRS